MTKHYFRGCRASMNAIRTSRQSASRRVFFGLSPWLLIGVTLILGMAIAFLSVKNTQREKGYRIQNMMDQAEALIWSLEAGTRTWMDMRPGNERLLQMLVCETARRPGIIFIAVTDDAGRIMAHSDPDHDPDTTAKELPPLNDAGAVPAWRLREKNGVNIFEVYRMFAPVAEDSHGASHGRRNGCRARAGGHKSHGVQQTSPGMVVIGLDQKPFEEALNRDVKNNLLSSILVAALALAGFVSLFWAHSARRSRRMLRDSQAMSAEVVGNLPLGLLTSDPKGNILTVNDTALALLNARESDPARVSFRDLSGIDWEGVIMELDKKGKILEREILLITPENKMTTVSLSAAVMHDEDGEFLGNLFILRDITDIKQLQAEAQRNDRLSALGNLAAGVAHEIRNPLSTVKGVATYLAKRMQPGGREHEAASTMIKEVDRLDRVVSELLEFARPGTLVTSETNLPDVVNRALRLADADLQAKDITVRIDAAPGFPLVFVNAERLAQALLNLILNSVQAMTPGGALTITLCPHPESNRFSVSVSDTGPGIPASAQALLFTPYFTTKSSGTGLGLAIVHQIIEGHGGNISVKSAPGAGAEFIISLPLKKPEPERV